MSSKLRRHGANIMAQLILLLDSLAYVMIVAVINGSLGFVSAMGVTVFGSFGVAKALGEDIALSWTGVIVGTIICGVIRGVLRYLEQYGNHYIAFLLLAKLRDKIFAKLRILAPAKLESKQKGNIIAMLTADIETLEVFYAHTISPICIAIIICIVVIVFVAINSSFYLSLVALVGYIIIGCIYPLVFSKKLAKSGVSYRKEFAGFNAYFLDSIKGLQDIILSGGKEKRREEVARRSGVLLSETKSMKHDTTRSGALTELTVSLFICITAFVGVLLVSNDVITVGRMVIGVVVIFGSFGPVIALSSLSGNLTQTFASGDRVLDLMEEEPLATDITDGESFSFESLVVNNLSFGYSDENVLKDISLSVKKGEIIGIVGESGCGKSTLIKLLMRFWKKSEGDILYNGIDIENINTQSLYDNVTEVSQSTYLFDGTIKENLLIAKENASDDEIITACKMASVHDFIESLPNGYETRVGSMGHGISTGEKQRIGLARAFLKGSPLVLLDEPTSNVDSINEGIILNSIATNKSDKAYIIVSHRQSTLAIADRVINL